MMHGEDESDFDPTEPGVKSGEKPPPPYEKYFLI